MQLCSTLKKRQCCLLNNFVIVLLEAKCMHACICFVSASVCAIFTSVATLWVGLPGPHGSVFDPPSLLTHQLIGPLIFLAYPIIWPTQFCVWPIRLFCVSPTSFFWSIKFIVLIHSIANSCVVYDCFLLRLYGCFRVHGIYDDTLNKICKRRLFFVLAFLRTKII